MPQLRFGLCNQRVGSLQMNILTSLFGKKRTIITRNPELMIWEVKSSGVKYSASISGIKLKLTKEAGTRESYGGKTLLARHFLGKEKYCLYGLFST